MIDDVEFTHPPENGGTHDLEHVKIPEQGRIGLSQV